jgi:prophage maintenance system killer protein
MSEEIIKLELEHFLDFSESIRDKSINDKDIKYTGFEEYPVREDKLKEMVDKTPSTDVISIAKYYLRSIILLQPFADANHRTALAAVELFLNKNGLEFNYNENEVIEFQKDLYTLRYKVYKTYEELGSEIINDEKNEIDDYCKKFIEGHLTKSN